MIFYQHALALGGTESRQADSTHVVSAWHLPGGYDAVNARALTYYFADKEAADRLAAKYENPPEMAFAYSLEDWDKTQKVSSSHFTKDTST